MTISTETRRAGPYAGDGATQVFAFAFKTYATADLLVVSTTAGIDTAQTLTTHYTVSLNADQNASPGGSITMLTAPAIGTNITVLSDRSLLQSLNVQNAGGFLPENFNNAMDNVVIGVQQINDQQDRTVRGALSDAPMNRLPSASLRANSFLAFDADGHPVASSLPDLDVADIAAVAAIAAEIEIVADADVDIATVADNIADVVSTASLLAVAAADTTLGFDSSGDIEARTHAEQRAAIGLDEAVFRAGTWDASAGSFPGSGTARSGSEYEVTTGGTVDSITFAVGDLVRAKTDDASTSTYAANWIKINNADAVASGALSPINVLSYGATGDGVTNDTTAINNAMAAAVLTGQSVYAPAGRYLTGTDARLENPGVEVFGDGPSTVFIKQGQNSLFRTLGTPPDKGAGLALASNASADTDEITLSTGLGASVSVDTLYVLLDESSIFTGNTGKKGEFVRVREVSGDTVKLWRYLKFSYATASTAKLVPVTLVDGVAYRSFRIEMDDTATVTSSNSFQELFALDIRWCKHPVVDDIEIVDSLHAGIFLHGCYSGHITNYRPERFGSNTTGTDDPASVDGLPGFGYTIREDSLNEGLVVDGVVAIRCRNTYDTTAGYSANFNHGEPTASIVSNILAIEPRGAGAGTHWPGYGIAFNNITVIGGRRNAVSIRSRATTVNGVTALNCRGPAVWVRGADGSDPALRGDDCFVSNVYANRTNLGEDLYIAGVDWRERGAVVDEGWRNTFDGITAVKTGGPILSIGHNGIGRHGVYRNMVGQDICQLATTTPDAVRIVNANTLANLVIDGLVVHSSDAKVRHLVSRETAVAVGSPIKVTIDNVRGTGYTGSRVSSATNMDGIRSDSGFYTPVQVSTNLNITSVTHYEAQYMRVGDVVTVSGKITINPTTAAQIAVRMSLPIQTNLTGDEHLGGGLRNISGSIQCAVIGDLANECAYVSGMATDTGGTNCYYSYTYRIN